MEYPDPSSFVSVSHLYFLGGDIELEKSVVLGGGVYDLEYFFDCNCNSNCNSSE